MERTLPRSGDWLDSFELLDPIGVGGMGAVFRALDAKLDRFVALKILPPEQADDPENVQRFYQEGKASARLDHENIARVFTIGHDQGLHYIAFEYIEGTTVRQRVERQGVFSVSETINFTLQIADALVHAAERGVVHRDIKPSNIIVTPHGRAKLVDMGLARRFERGGTDEALTQSGMTLGTFDYISPEQARDPRDVDVRSDLYSLGCTMYYMLTGQPPFPGGTVLQKLLSHREEPAPDVRQLNANVPANLAVMILKLMAKERDHRYQSPEQLSRDLLTLAGALGLRSISPEGLIWMNAEGPPAWERHLFWGLPTLALILVVGGLFWWGQDRPSMAPGLDDYSVTDRFEPAPRTSTDATASGVPAVEPGAAETTNRALPRASTETESNGSSTATALVDAPDSTTNPPRTQSVSSDEELRSILATIPNGSTIILADAGPYLIRPTTEPGGRGPVVVRGDLTIKAAPNVRPVIRLEPGGARRADVPALLRLASGRVTIEGVTFDLDPVDGVAPRSVLQTDNTALTLRRCVFRLRERQRTGFGLGPAAVLELNASAATPGERIALFSCHIDGGPGRAGILARGPLTVSLWDCTVAAAEPAIWFDNSGSFSTVAARLELEHVSILSGAGPVLRFEATNANVQMVGSLVAPPYERPRSDVTLVQIDNLDRLEWLGRNNLYARLDTFLDTRSSGSGRTRIYDYPTWADASENPREVGSLSTQEHVWEASDPAQSLTLGDDPSRAFRLMGGERPTIDTGARQGPFGPFQPPPLAVTSQSEPAINDDAPQSRPDREPMIEDDEPPPMPMEFQDPMDMEPMPMPDPEYHDLGLDRERSNGRETQATAREPVEAEAPPFNFPLSQPESRPNDEPSPLSFEPLLTTKPDAVRPSPAPESELAPLVLGDRPQVIRTTTQFLEVLKQLDPNKKGVVRLAADADLTFPTCELGGVGRLDIEAETSDGPQRPRIRFVPDPRDLTTMTDWPVLFRVRNGGLQIQGVDLLLAVEDAPAMGRWAAFGVGPGASLTLIGCTLTIEGSDRSAAVRAQTLDKEIGAGAVTPAASAATVRMVDSLLRCGDDLVDVAADRRLNLTLENSIVAAGGSIVHGHGLPRGLDDVQLNLELRQATAMARGGLVRLESALGEPNLPFVNIVAHDSIVTTLIRGNPLIRVDGQDDLDDISDRVQWEGRRVAYHNLNVYRRDQTSQPGIAPDSFNRTSWEVAVGRRDEEPFHGDVRFSQPRDPARPFWTLTPDDVRLGSDSPVASLGPDLQRIPRPGSSSAPEAEQPVVPFEELRQFFSDIKER